MFFFLKKPTV
jgi:MFS family permease